MADRFCITLRRTPDCNAARRAAGRVGFHDQAAAPEQALEEPGALPFPLHSVAATGPETWLACLAWGAVEVLLAPSVDAAASVGSVLEAQVALAGRLLDAVGQEPDRVRLLNDTRAGSGPHDARFGELPLLDVKPSGNRRQLLLSAVTALGEGRQAMAQWMTLPAGAAFGAVSVDEGACTLCFACVIVCPTRALRRQRGGRPVLLFTEGACVQCGICTRACPEQAIRLLPGVRLEEGGRESERPLAEGEMAHCAECGGAYLPRTVVAAALSRVGASSLLQGDAARLLQLCPSCRANSIMHAEFRPARPVKQADRGP
jgi:ferredoxin